MTKGRPKLSKEQAEARKALIIEIAKRLFLEEGYSAVSMRKIATKAKVSPMTLYQSFDNKRDILRYIWTDIFSEVSKECKLSFEPSADRHAQLYSFCKVFLDYWLKHPEHYRVVYLESDALENHGDTYFAENQVVTDLFAQLGERIQAVRLQDSASEIDLQVKLLTLQLQGIAHGLIVINEIPWGKPEQLLVQCLKHFY